ncbi:MAG TPA: hypothetical protein VF940_34445 [Streptosporangiaceae bacterium]
MPDARYSAQSSHRGSISTPVWLVRGFSGIYDAAFEGAPQGDRGHAAARQADGRADGEPVAALTGATYDIDGGQQFVS